MIGVPRPSSFFTALPLLFIIPLYWTQTKEPPPKTKQKTGEAWEWGYLAPPTSCIDSTHGAPRPCPFILAYYKWSKTGHREGLGCIPDSHQYWFFNFPISTPPRTSISSFSSSSTLYFLAGGQHVSRSTLQAQDKATKVVQTMVLLTGCYCC